MRWIYVIFTVLFALGISAPFMAYFFDPVSEVSENEKRDLAPMPEFDVKHLDSFPSRFTRYWKDHFGYREELISSNHYVKLDVLRISPLPDLVLLGEGDWYFMKGKAYQSYTGLNKFTWKQLKSGKEELQRRADFAKSRGIPYYIFVAPLKHRVYDDKLPLKVAQWEDSTQVDQFLALGKDIDGIEIIDLAEPLKELRNETKLYYKTDNHWNNKGGFVAYTEIVNTLRDEFPAIPPPYVWDDYIIEERMQKGGAISRYLQKEEELSELYYHFSLKEDPGYKLMPDTHEKFQYPKGFWYPGEFEERTICTRDENLPRLLWFRDSFGRMVNKHLQHHFSYTTEIFDAWMYRLNEHIIEEEQPDMVVVLVLERNISCLLLGGDCVGNY